MAVEVTVLVRFERAPDEDEVRNLIEDQYEDATVLEYDEEGC